LSRVEDLYLDTIEHPTGAPIATAVGA
jgi:hypothetical protein